MFSKQFYIWAYSLIRYNFIFNKIYYDVNVNRKRLLNLVSYYWVYKVLKTNFNDLRIWIL